VGFLILSAALVSTLLTGAATWYARRRDLLDHPGDRRSHTEPTPRGGGAGWVAAFLIFVGVYLLLAKTVSMTFPAVLAAGTAVLALLGWWDDHHDLDFRIRAAVQSVVSLLSVSVLAVAGVISGWAPALAAFLFIAWMVNLYNFMDGSNGLAGFQGLFVSLVLAALFARSGDWAGATIALVLAGSCAGFLPWNLGRARVFMGDVGSLALGFIVAALLVYGAGTAAFTLPVALMITALFLVDASLTLAVRILRGERWYNAHRQHLYQRLIARGWTHGRVLLAYQAVNLLLVLPGVVFGVNYPERAWFTAAVLGLLLGLGWYLSIRKTELLAEAK